MYVVYVSILRTAKPPLNCIQFIDAELKVNFSPRVMLYTTKGKPFVKSYSVNISRTKGKSSAQRYVVLYRFSWLNSRS